MYEQNFDPETKQKPINDKSDEVIVISRVTFNYIIIAITFLVVGIVIGVFGLNKKQDLTNITINETQLRTTLISILQDSNLNLTGTATDDADNRLALVDDDPYLGDEDAPIVIVEFSDFFCTYCKRHFDQTFTPLLENYGQYVRYVYRDYAQLTPESAPAAAAAQCAFEQGKFWEFHNEFFNNQQLLGRDFYIQTATKFGLDVDAFITCIDEGRYVDEVEIDLLDGQLEGVRGTPGFFVNGQFISGAQPYALFDRLIQKELQKANISYEVPATDTVTNASSETVDEETTENAIPSETDTTTTDDSTNTDADSGD